VININKFDVMNKTLLRIFPILILIFISCSDNIDNTNGNGNGNEQEKAQNPYKTDKDLSSSFFLTWDNKVMHDEYFVLGFGYDVTGKYAHPASVRNKVIKIREFVEDYEGTRVYIDRGTSSGPELSIRGTEKECIENMGLKAGFNENEISKYKNLFKGNFISAFEKDTSFPDLSYNYLGITQVNTNCRLSFHYTDYLRELVLSKYLTDEFKADLEIKTAEEIIKQYGTHILKDIGIGERIDYLYRYAADENNNSYNCFIYNNNQYFSLSPLVMCKKPEGDPPLKENLYIEVVDGRRHNPNAWMVDITNFKGERIIFDGWNNIITNDNLTLVNFRTTDCLIPIYEFIEDPAKKEAFIQAYEKYLSE